MRELWLIREIDITEKRMISKSRCLTPTHLLLYFNLHPPVPEINLTVKSISGYRCSG